MDKECKYTLKKEFKLDAFGDHFHCFIVYKTTYVIKEGPVKVYLNPVGWGAPHNYKTEEQALKALKIQAKKDIGQERIDALNKMKNTKEYTLGEVLKLKV